MDDIPSMFKALLAPHYRSPRNCYCMREPCFQMTCHNTLCGDKITVYVKTLRNSEITEISFLAEGCSIVIASASIMTTEIKGKTRENSLHKANSFLDHCSIFLRAPQPELPPLTGELFELAKVRQLSGRAKCARLPWFALKQALEAPAKTGPPPLS